MARNKYYKYRMKVKDGKLPKGLVRIDDNGLAIYGRLLSASLVEKYQLEDLNDFKKLTKIRSSKGIKQTDLAEMTGISVRTIQGWELNGMNRAYLGQAVSVADALKVHPRELLEDE